MAISRLFFALPASVLGTPTSYHLYRAVGGSAHFHPPEEPTPTFQVDKSEVPRNVLYRTLGEFGQKNPTTSEEETHATPRAGCWDCLSRDGFEIKNQNSDVEPASDEDSDERETPGCWFLSRNSPKRKCIVKKDSDAFCVDKVFGRAVGRALTLSRAGGQRSSWSRGKDARMNGALSKSPQE